MCFFPEVLFAGNTKCDATKDKIVQKNPQVCCQFKEFCFNCDCIASTKKVIRYCCFDRLYCKYRKKVIRYIVCLKIVILIDCIASTKKVIKYVVNLKNFV